MSHLSPQRDQSRALHTVGTWLESLLMGFKTREKKSKPQSRTRKEPTSCRNPPGGHSLTLPPSAGFPPWFAHLGRIEDLPPVGNPLSNRGHFPLTCMLSNGRDGPLSITFISPRSLEDCPGHRSDSMCNCYTASFIFNF